MGGGRREEGRKSRFRTESYDQAMCALLDGNTAARLTMTGKKSMGRRAKITIEGSRLFRFFLQLLVNKRDNSTAGE
jgi:hypothetical protein